MRAELALESAEPQPVDEDEDGGQPGAQPEGNVRPRVYGADGQGGARDRDVERGLERVGGGAQLARGAQDAAVGDCAAP